MTPTPGSDQIFIGLRALIMGLVPGIEVVQGLGNGVPMPDGQFIAMTDAGKTRLSTNVSTYDIGLEERSILQATEYRIQLDCYGPNSSDHSTVLMIMLRDQYACDVLAEYGVQPLYATEPTHSALVNGEENYEQRWMLTAVLQFNPVVTLSQQYADQLNADLVSVDATFPP